MVLSFILKKYRVKASGVTLSKAPLQALLVLSKIPRPTLQILEKTAWRLAVLQNTPSDKTWGLYTW